MGLPYSKLEEQGIQFPVIEAHVEYKCTEEYNKFGESGINPFDLDLGIEWTVKEFLLSDKDKNSQSFLEYKKLPRF